MAEPLKNHFDAAVVRRIGAMLRSAHAGFPERRFVAEATKGLGGPLPYQGSQCRQALAQTGVQVYGHVAFLTVDRHIDGARSRERQRRMHP